MKTVLRSIHVFIIFLISVSASADPRDERHGPRENESYAACIANNNSAITCNTYPDRGNDNGRGYIACLNAGNSPITCSTYPSKVSGDTSDHHHGIQENNSYAACIEKNNSAITCSTYPDRGNDNGRGYIACLNAGNSPITCSTYPSGGSSGNNSGSSPNQPVTPIQTEPAAPVTNHDEDSTSSTSEDSSSSADSDQSSDTDEFYLMTDWRSRGLSCEELQKKYPNKSFVIVATMERVAVDEINLVNPVFCMSKKDRKTIYAQLSDQSERLVPSSGYGLLSYDGDTAEKLCAMFDMPYVVNIVAEYPVYRNFALFRFGDDNKIIAENSGIDPEDSGASITHWMSDVRCGGREISKKDLMSMKPIPLN